MLMKFGDFYEGDWVKTDDSNTMHDSFSFQNFKEYVMFFNQSFTIFHKLLSLNLNFTPDGVINVLFIQRKQYIFGKPTKSI